MPRLPGSTVGLPGFSWDDKLRNYVNNDTGRMVKRSDVTDLLRDMTKASEDRMSELGRLFANDTISPRAFYEAMQQEVKLATNTNAALAKGGWAQLTQADRDANETKIREEYARLWQFARDKQDGLLTPAQIEARANLYANSTYSRYWEITTAEQQARGMTQERLVTVGDEKVCEECSGEAAKGWVPIGAYNPPIHPGCRCDVEYSKDGAEGTEPEQAQESIAEPEPMPAHSWMGANEERGGFLPTDNANDQWAAGLTDEERAAVIRYTGSGYKTLNRSLNEGFELSPSDQALADTLDTVIDKAGKLQEPATVYRGITIGDQALVGHGAELAGIPRAEYEEMVRVFTDEWAEKNFPIGSLMQPKSYQSTSFDTLPALTASVERNTVGVMFEILTDSGAYLDYAKGLSLFDDEAELLLGRNSILEVVNVLKSVPFLDSYGEVAARRAVIQLIKR